MLATGFAFGPDESEQPAAEISPMMSALIAVRLTVKTYIQWRTDEAYSTGGQPPCRFHITELSVS